MVPAFVVLSIYQGQTFNDVVTFRNPDQTPIDLSGKQARMQIRAYRGGQVIMELSTADGRISLDDQGHLQFNVTAADTAELTTIYDYESWVYDCELFEDDAGTEFVERVLQGVVIFWPEITRG